MTTKKTIDEIIEQLVNSVTNKVKNAVNMTDYTISMEITATQAKQDLSDLIDYVINGVEFETSKDVSDVRNNQRTRKQELFK